MKPPQHAAWCLVLVAVLRCTADALSTSTEQIHAEEKISSEENGRGLAKRQTSFQSNEFGQQQIPQEYFDFIQQTDAAGNPVPPPQRPQFGQQTAQQQLQQQVQATGSPLGVTPPPRTTTLSPFALEQRELQEEYARRALVEQLTALNRPRTRRPPAARPQSSTFPGQPSPASQQPQPTQREPLRFVDADGQVREQEFPSPQQVRDFAEPQPQDFVASQRPVQFAPAQQDFTAQQQEFVAQQQDAAAQQQEFVAAAQQQGGPVPSAPVSVSSSISSSSEPFSYAQVRFGPPVAGDEAEATRGRPKGQRSVSRPAGRVQLVDALTQQSVDRPVTTVDSVPAIEYPVTTIGPAVLGARLLQNVVYIQPNGQMYKPIEDVEPVVQIPRRVVSSPAPVVSAVATASTTAASPAPSEDDQPVVLIPQPPKKSHGRPRQEGRKPGRARPEVTLQQHHEQQHQQHLRQHHHQQSDETEPADHFLASLLARLQQQQKQQNLEPPEATVATAAVARPRGGQRTKGHHGGRSESSKYLVDRDQLQLLQFPDELKALSTAELKALEQASAQIADKPAASQKHQPSSIRNGRPVTVAPSPPPPPPPPSPLPSQIQPQPTTTTAARLALGNRPVPKPVELNEQQRQFLLSQGIRNLYRVDYDQYGNALPLTYVLALDNRPKRAGPEEQDQQQ